MAGEMKETSQLENELAVIGRIQDALKYGQFQGTHAQDVAIGQLYLQGLYKALEGQIKALKSEARPVAVDPVAVPASNGVEASKQAV